jgi:hypothetical protein
MVVENAKGQRIAIELDGDKTQSVEEWEDAIKNQRILERVGWVFWRCWAASYRLNPDVCFADLLAALKSNSVTPSSESSSISEYTEFRQVSNNDNTLMIVAEAESDFNSVTEN